MSDTANTIRKKVERAEEHFAKGKFGFHKTDACLCAIWNIAKMVIRVTLSHA